MKIFTFSKISLLALSAMFLLSCSPDNDFEEAQETIDQYIAVNNINAEQTASGLYYEIETPGTGELPVGTNLFESQLRGLLVDGREWLSTANGPTFRSLVDNPNILQGLREGMRQFREGSSGKLIIPPSLGYGNTEFNGIPQNSVLIIDISDVKLFQDADAYSEALLSSYIAANNLTPEKTESGIYYIIEEMGSDTMPTSSSTVSVNYRGYFIDGTEFDANDPSVGPATFGLSQVIAGWTEGLQLFGEGGKGTLMIPSDLAYGANGQQTIPPHTPLIFDIELLSTSN